MNANFYYKITSKMLWGILLTPIFRPAAQLPDLLSGIRTILFWFGGLLFGGLILFVVVWYFFGGLKGDVRNMYVMRKEGSKFGEIFKYFLEAAGVYILIALVVALVLFILVLLVTGVWYDIVVGLFELWNSLFPDSTIEIPDNPFDLGGE